ncbi:O-antigen/teichoic acid export membrane protein [Caldalkalibacillus uzonensis]|uniref:O-antigen/teichoic acid export membrane protein n=1 Tax=Caldalkalibacillus uzonensis TaxID=353224 RepID=A0ABU0CTN1_9BACI|nr:flippase [Caldalkalibacillus uzonensis]MDQ0339453.1 O-antigen/teichoic acid export membrane protein [Caldalkalibacillus uzonensis]
MLKSIFKLLSNSMLYNATYSFLIKAIGAALGFFLNILLARILGAEGIGIYFLAISIITVCTVITRLGLDNALLRYTSLCYSNNDWQGIKGLYKLMLKITTFSSILVTLIMIFISDYTSMWIFNEPELGFVLKIMSLSILPVSLINLYAEVLKGLNKIKTGMFLQSVSLPLINVILIMICYTIININVNHIVLIYAITAFITLCMCELIWLKSLPQFVRKINGFFNRDELLQTSIPLMWVASLNLVLSFMDTFMLGWLGTSEDVGIYNIAAKLAFLSSMILIAVNGVLSQKFAVFWGKQKYQALEKLAQLSTMVMSVISFVILLVFLFFNKPILSLFGPNFIDGTYALVILAIGQFVTLSTGPVASLLMMTGYGRFHRNNVLLSAFVNLILNLCLIPIYGINGAAVATAISLMVKNVLAVIFVKKELKINVFDKWISILKNGWCYYYGRKK